MSQVKRRTYHPVNTFDIESGEHPVAITKRNVSHCRRLIIFVCCFLLSWILYLIFRQMTYRDACQVMRHMENKLQETNNDPLPKIIHQQWKNTHIPEGDFTRYMKLWKELYPEPEYKHILWTDDTQREFIQNNYEFFLEVYDNYRYPIQRADAVRYFILYHYGGLYADADYEPIKNFWNLLPTDVPGVIESPYRIFENVQNSLMTSPKGHPFWKHVFELLATTKDRSILESTGPAFLDRAMNTYTPVDDGSSAMVLPCELFHRIPTGVAGQNAPFVSRFFRYVMAYSPLSKECGNWREKDHCEMGIHHNTVTWF